MGVNTKFIYDNDITFDEVKSLLENKLNVEISFNPIKAEINYGYFTFKYNGEDRQFWIFRNSYDYEGKTMFDLGAWGHAVEIMRMLGESLGGWLIENDCDNEEKYYIEKIDSDIFVKTNKQKLYSVIAENIGYDNTEKVLKFIMENKEKIEQLKFGEK